MPLGAFQGRDGRSWTLDTPQHLIDQFRVRKIDLPIDYEHQADDPERAKNGPIPAAGWITDLELRANGIWGHVRWTDTVANMIQDREYRFLSPTFKYTPVTRKVMALSGAGLVHKPNLHLTALASEESTMPDQDENLSAIAKALGLPAQSDQSEILTAINTQSSPDPAKFVPIEAVRDLMTDRNTKVAMAREGDVAATVNDALSKGFITPGMRDWATALCRQDPESFAAFTTAAPPAFAHLFDTVEKPSMKDQGSGIHDDAELAICKQLDLEPGTLIET